MFHHAGQLCPRAAYTLARGVCVTFRARALLFRLRVLGLVAIHILRSGMGARLV